MIMLDQIEAAFCLWDRFTKSTKTKEELVSTRFIRLFESHGVSRNQIPRVFEHGLTLADMADNRVLLEKLALDDSIIKDACNLFAVRREWLDGASSQVYPIHFFYREPETAIEFIEKLNIVEGHFATILFAFKPATESASAPALLVFQEEIGTIDDNPDNPYYRYHLCSGYFYSSSKDRPYLTALIATCFLRRILVKGLIVSEKVIAAMASGEILPPLLKKAKGIWHPDDMPDRPEIFLDGISDDKIGALEVWLELESKGYMKLGIDRNHEQKTKKLFDQELEKYRD